tara:strand:- start:145 stop:597 length:453 start_codon:yes stop_codon:yes gene_type:complete
MKKKYFYFLTIACLIIIALGVYFYSTTKEQAPSINQGAYGKVVLYSGNCMPGAGGCKTSYVSRTIYIREPATMEAMEITYLENKTTLIKTIESNNNGFYQVELPPGTYSIFVEDEGKEYCNSFGGRGEVCQITIETGIKEYNIRIDHAAW